ncbi:hypothetical protein Sango_2090300 [Sesamum angolense]|uniref:Uncharacterized protein n=1 Tax=Sesamum angolense TaxID=2727404 RepID=A0AAE1WBJ0_9LAMI|nr:hypothetical protein Sango_2090300 [Sesamum angolense]
MGSKGRLLFDLNEPPAENEDDNDAGVCFQPQRAIPSSSTATASLFVASAGPQGIVNNHAFSHASAVSGFQPFVRSKVIQGSDSSVEKRSSSDMLPTFASSPLLSNGQDIKTATNLQPGGPVDAQTIEKEEGEWSDAEGSVDAYRRSVIYEDSSGKNDTQVLEKGTVEMMGTNVSAGGVENISLNPGDEDAAPVQKQREVRGAEANHALKCANNLGKRPKLDQQKEAMLGKKRSRQTMLINIEDVKQAGALKTSTPRRQIPPPTITRTVKEARPTLPSAERGDKQTQPLVRDAKQADVSTNEGNNFVESNECKSESNGDSSSGHFGPPRRLNSSTDVSSEGQAAPVPRQSSWKPPPDTRQLKNSQFSGRKQAISQSLTDPKLASKKLPTRSQLSQATSIRIHRWNAYCGK